MGSETCVLFLVSCAHENTVPSSRKNTAPKLIIETRVSRRLLPDTNFHQEEAIPELQKASGKKGSRVFGTGCAGRYGRPNFLKTPIQPLHSLDLAQTLMLQDS